MTPPTTFAHEAWFTHEGFPLDWRFAGEGVTLALLAAAVLVTLAVRAVSRLWPVDAAMLVLLVYGSDPALRPAVSAPWPCARLARRPRTLCAAEA